MPRMPDGAYNVRTVEEGLRTSNPIERALNQKIKRRTVKVRVFPSVESLLRLVTAIVVEIDEKWTSEPKAGIRMEDSHDRLSQS